MNDLLLLSMLLPSAKYGYQLKKEAGWIMGQDALHNNLVYPMLRKFLEEGWVSKKAVAGQRGQTRQQYALTAAGRKHLFEQLGRFNERDASSEDAFFLRIGLFEALKAESREATLGARETYLVRRDEKLGALQSHMDVGRFGGEILRYMRKQIETELEWIRHLRRIAKT